MEDAHRRGGGFLSEPRRKPARQRLDQLLLARGLVASRHQGQQLIAAGRVRVAGQVVDKAGALVAEDAELALAFPPAYVSRGGLKLAGALAHFGLTVAGRRALDIGASTGGFTDCLLQQGAARVLSVDVGYGQFDWKLRQDPRVRLLERTNARTLTREQLYGDGEPPADLAVIDVSFISLTKVLPALLPLLAEHMDILALVKPQFEAGKGQVGKKGVVRSAEVHGQVLSSLCDWSSAHGLMVAGLTYSPLRGPEGNIEFWLHLRRDNKDEVRTDLPPRIAAAVEEAHRTL